MPGGLHPPLAVLLAFPTPNYINPETKPKYVLALACLMAPVSTVLLFMRLWVRFKIQRNPGWDDWLMLSSFFPVTALTVLFPWVIERVYFNRHVQDVPFSGYPEQRKYVYAIYLLFTIAGGLIKVSVLLFYRRLSSRTISVLFRWLLRISILAIGLHTFIFTIITVFLCTPISAFWDQTSFALQAKGYKYHCMNEGAKIVANGVLSTIYDWIAASLPAILCWKLQMSARQKWALYAIFATSYSTVAIGAARTYSTYHLFFETYDVTWTASNVWLWSLLELHIGSMCANAPALKAFYTHYAGVKSQSSRTRSSRSKTAFSSSGGTSSLLSRIWNRKKGSQQRSHDGYLSSANTHVSSTNGVIMEMKAHYDVHKDSSSSNNRDPEYVDLVVGHLDDQERGYAPSWIDIPAVGHEVQALPPIHSATSPTGMPGWKRWMHQK